MATAVDVNKVSINGVDYVRADSVETPQAKPGKREVVVIDRGWIFCGDVERKDGRIYLTRPVWVFNWQGIGFDGVLKNPKDPKAQLRPVPKPMIHFPLASEIFSVPVDDNWGL